MDIIDGKKIEEATNKLCDYDSIYDSECRIEGFKKGVNWTIQEVLKDLQHKKINKVWKNYYSR